MTVERLSDEEAIEIARAALDGLGKTSSSLPNVARGVLNQVVCFSDLGLAVRVSPKGATHSVRRGYHVADHAGRGVALAPLCIVTARGHLAGVFTLLSPAGLDSNSWVAGQVLVSHLHERTRPTFFLPHFDPVDDLFSRIELLRGGLFDPWVSSLIRQGHANRQALINLDDTPLVISHGDLHAGQVMQTDEGYLLTDFDRACLADPEADWGRIYAWHNAAELDEATFDAAVHAAGSNLRFDRVHLYGRTYALRYVTFLAVSYLEDPSRGVPVRLAGFAESLGLDPGVLNQD